MAAAGLLLAVSASGAAPGPADGWQAAGSVRGVPVEMRPAPEGLRAYRGRVSVCAGFDELERFVNDVAGFTDWIAFTESARSLPDDGRGARYHLVTSTPWPLAPRDLTYRVTTREAGAERLHLSLEGLPDAVPPADDAVRLKGARGGWLLRRESGCTEVRFWLQVDAGGAPAFFANRRLRATVGRTLANLRDRFPC